MIRICFNQASLLVFSRLSPGIQQNIIAQQEVIEGLVKKYNPDAYATGGFRCPSYNSGLHGSLPDSFHIWGMARDYRKSTIFVTRIPGLKAIVEKECVHFEMAGV